MIDLSHAKTVPVRVLMEQEHWNSYMLEDGTELRVKIVLKRVERLEGVQDQAGKPVYNFEHQTISCVEVGMPRG